MPRLLTSDVRERTVTSGSRPSVPFPGTERGPGVSDAPCRYRARMSSADRQQARVECEPLEGDRHPGRLYLIGRLDAITGRNDPRRALRTPARPECPGG